VEQLHGLKVGKNFFNRVYIFKNTPTINFGKKTKRYSGDIEIKNLSS
jgi:hypothetical protein